MNLNRNLISISHKKHKSCISTNLTTCLQIKHICIAKSRSCPNLLWVCVFAVCVGVCVLCINAKLTDKLPAAFLCLHLASMHSCFFLSFIYSFHLHCNFRMQPAAAIHVQLFYILYNYFFVFSVGFIYSCNITN